MYLCLFRHPLTGLSKDRIRCNAMRQAQLSNRHKRLTYILLCRRQMNYTNNMCLSQQTQGCHLCIDLQQGGKNNHLKNSLK